MQAKKTGKQSSLITGRRRRIILGIILLFIFQWLLFKPSGDRDWAEDQAILPYAEINGNLVHIHNIRNFSYTAVDEYTPGYYDKTFDIEKLTAVYYVVEHFSSLKSLAHTMLSFEFEGDNFVSISVEIRKEKGESFSALKGMLKAFELMYVVADERDAIRLRTNVRNDPVSLYPVKATGDMKKALFLDMVTRGTKLRERPEFYNTLTNTCTTNIVRHVNRISPRLIPFSYKVLLPGHSDRLAYALGLIETTLPFEEIRDYFSINKQALLYGESHDFSRKIREFGLNQKFGSKQ